MKKMWLPNSKYARKEDKLEKNEISTYIVNCEKITKGIKSILCTGINQIETRDFVCLCIRYSQKYWQNLF